MSEDQGHDAEFEKSTRLNGLSEKVTKAAELINLSPMNNMVNPIGTVLGELGAAYSNRSAEDVARAFGVGVWDELQKRVIELRRDDLARQAGRSIESIIKARGSTKGEVMERAGTGKNRFADIIKGRIDTKNKPLDIVLISDLCIVLGVVPSVLLGDLTEEEFEIVEKLREMGEEQRAAVVCIIESMPEGD